MKFIRIFLLIIIIIGIALLFTQKLWVPKLVDVILQHESRQNKLVIIPPKICTKETKKCEDGSYVKRTEPSCEFETCPTPKTISKPAKKPSPSPTPPQTSPIIKTPSSSKIEWGAYVGSIPERLPKFEALVGSKTKLVADFESWDVPFPTNLSNEVGKQGKKLIVFWEPNFGFDNIINGSQDAYISQFASGAKTYGYPIILVPFDEMNLNESAWGYGANENSAPKFIEAWRHIHDLFAGVNNVKFGLAYNNVSTPDVLGNQFDDYYPGDEYVDYVGVDGFNFNKPLLSFGQIFDSAITTLQSFKKPIYIFSAASVPGASKAEWIREGLGRVVSKYPNLKGWVWFNQDGSDGNWLVNTDSESLKAFKNVVQL